MTTTEKKTVTRRKRQGRQYAAFIRFGVSADELALIDAAVAADGRSCRTDYCRVQAVKGAMVDATRATQYRVVLVQEQILEQHKALADTMLQMGGALQSEQAGRKGAVKKQ